MTYKKGNASIIAIIVIAILVVAGATYAVLQSQPMPGDMPVPPKTDQMMQDDQNAMGDEMMKEADSMMKDEDAMMDESDTMMKNDEDAMMKDEEKMTDGSDTMMKAAGSYEPYAASKLANANSGDVVLFFRAVWCPTCRALDADIRSNLSSIPDGLTILDVDYDNSASLKQKYGITYQHTFVQVDANGNQIAKWSGSPTLAALVSQVQ